VDFLIWLVVLAVAIVTLRRTRKLTRESATHDEVAQLTKRVYELENTVQQLHGVLAERIQELNRSVGELEGLLAKAATKAPITAPPSPAAAATPPATPPPAESVRVTHPPAPPSPAGRPGEAPAPRPFASPAAPPSITTPAAQRQPQLLTSEMAGAPRERRWLDLEERLGANWLNKIGTAAFVIGVALFLNYTMRYLGPAGKISVGYALSATLIGLGVVGEKRERYRIPARAVLGGGWAIAYFTTYAMHNVAAVRLVETAAAAFALLFGVAAAMVLHSLRYNSQVATGFAYLLGFASVAVSRITVGTLVASAALAASLVVVLRRRRWYRLEPPAIVASYAVHWLWLRQIFEALGGHKPFPEFKAGVTLLTLYWLVWMVSYFLRDSTEREARMLLTGSFLLNAAGYLAVLRYQSLYPELRFWFLLAVGVTYLALAPLAERLRRRPAFVLTTTFGATLLAAAIPYRYSSARLEILWLVEAEAFVVAGWRLAEAHLRKLGWAAAGALTIYVTLHDVSPRLAVWGAPDHAMGWMLLALAAAFYLNARFAPRLLREHASETDTAAASVSYGAATGFLLGAVWVALPFMWVGLVWATVAVALGAIGRRADELVVRACGHGAALFAAVRLLSINLRHAPSFHGISLRLLTVGLAAALFYLSARRISPSEVKRETGARIATAFARYGGIPAAYTWSATLLAALLVWNESTNAAVGLGWALLGLALLETGRASYVSPAGHGVQGDPPLRAQGHMLLGLSFARILIADLNAVQRVGDVSARLITVSLLAAIYYYAAFTATDNEPRMRSALYWFGAGALAALMRFELATAWVAVGWAGLTVVVYLAGRRFGVPAMRHQAYVLTLLVGVRCAFDNFYQVGRVASRFTNTRTLTVAAAAALLYALLAMSLLEKRRVSPPPVFERMAHLAPSNVPSRAVRWFEKNAHQLFFFVPTVLLTVLVSLEVRRSYLTAAWGLEGLLVFALTLRLGERTFRWFSLGLLLLCVGRIVAVDVWALDPLGRIISFMGLGAALLLVSYLYARYRELLRRYL